ncbi:unnamed protein product [Fusarium langsethiae]|nr:unnamed protein product [Fusarium langsethiae]
MCYITVYHFTHCNTHRRAIINPITGATAFHPFELPQRCIHTPEKLITSMDPNDTSPCPAHGSCCQAGQVFVCEAETDSDAKCAGWQAHHRILEPESLDLFRSHLRPITAKHWEKLQLNTDEFAYEDDIRRQFFDAGARMWELSRIGKIIIDVFPQNQWFDYGAEQEEQDFLNHGEKYWEWMVARKELLQLTEAWESLASVGCMEVCPSKLLAVHPWMKYAFYGWNERQPVDFPQFPGIPFAFLENCERQEEILRWHPYYACRDTPFTPTIVDTLWTSPNVPQRYNPELIHRIESANKPGPGEWEGILAARRNSLPLRQYAEASYYYSMQAGCGSASPRSEQSSGPKTPPWVIPYGEEPEFDWKDIHWYQPATLVESPAVSPKTIPTPGESASVEQISSVPYDDGCMDAIMFLFDQFLGVGEPVDREFLHISVSEDGSGRLKRRRSENDVESEVRTPKRCRTA